MHKVDNLPPYCAVVKKSGSLNFLDPSGPAWPVTGVLFLLYMLVLDKRRSYTVKLKYMSLDDNMYRNK